MRPTIRVTKVENLDLVARMIAKLRYRLITLATKKR